MTSDQSNVHSKGKRQYWSAVILWSISALGATALYSTAPKISVIGKVIIGILLIGSAMLLLRANIFSKYAVGIVALLGMLGNLPGSCAVFDPATQVQGLLSILLLIVCAVVWHAFLISDHVTAYLKWYRQSKGLKPEL